MRPHCGHSNRPESLRQKYPANISSTKTIKFGWQNSNLNRRSCSLEVLVKTLLSVKSTTCCFDCHFCCLFLSLCPGLFDLLISTVSVSTRIAGIAVSVDGQSTGPQRSTCAPAAPGAATDSTDFSATVSIFICLIKFINVCFNYFLFSSSLLSFFLDN